MAVEAVSPEVEAGRFPSKRSVGERVAFEADVFADGHDAVAGVLRYIRENARELPALIEYEYEGEDTVAEVRKCFDYCKTVLLG